MDNERLTSELKRILRSPQRLVEARRFRTCGGMESGAKEEKEGQERYSQRECFQTLKHNSLATKAAGSLVLLRNCGGMESGATEEDVGK